MRYSTRVRNDDLYWKAVFAAHEAESERAAYQAKMERDIALEAKSPSLDQDPEFGAGYEEWLEAEAHRHESMALWEDD